MSSPSPSPLQKCLTHLLILILGSDRSSFIVSKNATLEDLRQTYYIEMACNTLLGNGSPTMISPPDRKKYFTLELADIACFDRQVSVKMIT